MKDYLSCLNEKSYEDYFQCIREYINSKNSFEGASYFIRIGSKTEAIDKKSIFPTIYGYIISRYYTLPEDSYLIVSLRKRTATGIDTIEYITNIGKRRNDIYLDNFRTKLPESILLRNSKDNEEQKKLIEVRPYDFKTKEDIIKLEKRLRRKLDNEFPVPLPFSLILLINNPVYFPNIYYISRPYTCTEKNSEFSYIFKIIFKRSDIIKRPIKLFNDNLCFLSIIEFIDSPTIEPYALGLDYHFELEKENLNRFEIQVKYDEFEFRIYNSIIEVAKAISELKFSPADIKTYQVVIEDNKTIFIDIASGIDLPINQRGLYKTILDAIDGIAESIYYSPLLNHCIIKDKYIICNEKITKSDLPEKLTRNLNLDEILYTYKNTSSKKINELIKYAKIKDTKLLDIIIEHKKDEFEENREIVSKALELYLRSYNN